MLDMNGAPTSGHIEAATRLSNAHCRECFLCSGLRMRGSPATAIHLRTAKIVTSVVTEFSIDVSHEVMKSVTYENQLAELKGVTVK
jgi:hypothetical protein